MLKESRKFSKKNNEKKNQKLFHFSHYNKMAVDSALTPPLSLEEKKQKKIEKKARKEARRAAAETASTIPIEEFVASVSAVVGEKRKADDVELVKTKKIKKEAKLIKAGKATPALISAFLEENNISFEPETAKDEFTTVLHFNELGLEEGIKQGLKNFEKPTPIQSASFPIMFGGRDVIGIAETGSGKTVAFGVPALQHILSITPAGKGKKAPVSVLVVAPTRELAMQTHSNLSSIAATIPSITSVCIYGGVSKDDQKKILNQGPRIVVGTPGRLLDLIGEGALDLSNVSWLVLDEADRMLDRGFENDIREIIKYCLPLPKEALGPITMAGETETPTARIVSSYENKKEEFRTDEVE